MKTIEKATATGVLTNSCTCQSYNEDLGDFEPAPECWGDCWRDQVEEFEMITKDLRDSNETYWWKVEDLRLWDREVSGYFQAEKIRDLIAGMTVNSEWIMRYSVFADRIEYSLSHHDAMGSNSVLRGVTGQEYEDKVRY
jgi:hypothetical protein